MSRAPAGSDVGEGAQGDDAPAGALSPLRLTALGAAILAAVGILLFLYLSAYFANRYHVPVGNDAPQYLARARIVAGGGLDALANAFPPPLTANPDRPGYPVIATLLDSATGIGPERLAFVLSAVASVVIGLAASAFARAALEEPAWSAPVYALLVGGSTSTVLTAIGHMDNLMADALLLAGAAAVVLTADGRPAIAAAILLLGATAIVHWNFAVLFAVVLAVFTVALVPSSLRALRGGTHSIDTPAARVTGLLAGSAVLGGAAFLLTPGAPHVAKLPRAQMVVAYARTSSKFRLDVLGPLAAVGAGGLALMNPTRRRLFGLILLLVWGAVGLGAILLFEWGLSVPVHRLLPFAYGIPILAAAGLMALGRLASERLGRVGTVAGVTLIMAGLLGSGLVAYRILSVRAPFLSQRALVQTATVADYAVRYTANRPVVLLVMRPSEGGATLFGVAPAYRWTAAWLRNGERSGLYVYLGTAPNFLAGKPSVGDDPLFNETSATLWDSVKGVAAGDPVIVVMKAFTTQFGSFVSSHPGARVAPGVAILNGPLPPGGRMPLARLPDPPRNGTLVALALATLLSLAVAGLGWSASLLPTGWVERVACAPTFGIATLALGGYGADRVGVSLTGGQGVVVALAVAALGWVPLAIRGAGRRASSRRRPRPEGAEDANAAS